MFCANIVSLGSINDDGMKKLLILLLAGLTLSLGAQAQIRWYNPLDAGAVVHGQGFDEIRGSYVRLPDRAKGVVRDAVWNLSRNSAGLSIVFRSNASDLVVRYQVTGGLNMFHMPSTGVSGIDLFAKDSEGRVRWCAPEFAPAFKDTITYKYNQIAYPEEGEYEYQMFLPLYNGVRWLEIGAPDGAGLTFIPAGDEKPVVIYGTSIAQGACASRPGMCFGNMISRQLQIPVVNLGFSGNGRLEPEVLDFIAEIDASVYVLDCLPNLSSYADVTERVINAVDRLRAHSDSPILLVEHCGNSGEPTSRIQNVRIPRNAEQRAAYDHLVTKGCKDLYYLTYEEIALGMDGMVEGIHPNDVGMTRYAAAYEKKLREILDLR